MKEIVSEKLLEEQLENLPKEMDPKRDLWLGIEKAIAAQPQRESIEAKKKIVPLAWAASVCAAVLLSWVTLTPPNSVNEVNLLSVMQQDFKDQKQLMLTAYGKSDTSEVSEEIRKQLTELSSARDAIYKALENDPNNSELINLLRWTQNQELALIEQIYSPQWQTI